MKRIGKLFLQLTNELERSFKSQQKLILVPGRKKPEPWDDPIVRGIAGDIGNRILGQDEVELKDMARIATGLKMFSDYFAMLVSIVAVKKGKEREDAANNEEASV